MDLAVNPFLSRVVVVDRREFEIRSESKKTGISLRRKRETKKSTACSTKPGIAIRVLGEVPMLRTHIGIQVFEPKPAENKNVKIFSTLSC